ncbi:MAG: T9SS type A sorting domain-containing protein [candidate division WOR-3 bacterium]
MKYISFFSILLSLSFTLTGSILNAQEDPIFHCPEVGDYAFEGESQPTLCQQYYSISCDVQLGVGTPYPKSSLFGPSVSGNVCIIGDFEVDAPFSFIDAIVKIEPGVMIELKSSAVPGGPNGALLLDNAKLFACEGMWKGIYLSAMSSITTKGGTWIEDADKAIYATGFSTLYVQSTRFNRNWIGMELDGSLFAPILFVFSQNQFTCTAPLSMSGVSEIGYAGVVLKNASLFTQSNFNLFSDMRYGIYAQGSTSSIGASNLTMLRLRDAGIYMQEGVLNLRNSYFGIRHYGINIGLAKVVDIRNTDFSVATLPTSIRRIGIYVDKFGVNSNVRISGINFDADMEGTTNKVTGIYLRGGNISGGTKIRISNSQIAFRAKDSHGIYLDGIFPSSSTTEIWNNYIRVSNTTQDPGMGRPSGIETVGGDKNNLSIKWNSFTSYTVHTLPPNVIGPPQWNYGAYLRSNFFGVNNDVSVNSFNDDVQTLQFGLISALFSNGRYCSNMIRGSGWAVGVLFQGACAGTDFRGNVFRFAGVDALLISNGATIGVQEHKGNEWYNISGVEPLFHARCQGNPLYNKFIVHTSQSCGIEPDPCFNPYHPRKIEPPNDFFAQQPGTPLEGCNYELTHEIDELSIRIAQGDFVPPTDNPAMAWILRRNLYHKLKDDPNLVSAHSSLPMFVANNQNTSVGKFYEVHAAIENALRAEPGIDTSTTQIISGIVGSMEEMIDIDEVIEQYGINSTLKSQKESLITQFLDMARMYDSLRNIYEAQVAINLEAAYQINQSIDAADVYEVNEKLVNHIRILSLMQQGGNLKESQVALLQSISQQDYKQGGPAVHTAWGMLQTCAKPQDYERYASISLDTDYLEANGIVEERSIETSSGEKVNISIWPNPTNGLFVINNPAGRSGQMSIIDISGRLWVQHKFSGDVLKFNMAKALPSGVYTVRFDMEDGACTIKKLIVQEN